MSNKIIFFLILLAACLVSCSTTKKVAHEDLDSMPIIDAHLHTIFKNKINELTGQLQTRENFLKELKDAGIVAAVAHVIQTGEGYDPDLKSVGIIHCAGIDGKKPFRNWVEKGLRSQKYSCIKVYLGYVLRYAHDPYYQPAYDLAKKYDVPVVFHTGDLYPQDGLLKYSHPMDIDEVATKNPDVRFVIAHIGNPWIDTAAEVAYKNKNVWIDGSALLTGDLSTTDPEKVEKYVVEPIRWTFGYLEDPSKLMFGTDWPLVRIKPYLDAFKKAIPKEYWKQVFYENAVKVFKIKVKATQNTR